MTDHLPTFAVALLFAAIFLLGRRVAYHPGQKGRRRFLSLAAGISIAYIFLHVMPSLNTVREMQVRANGFRGMFPEYNVYLWSLAGFILFHIIQSTGSDHHSAPGNADASGHAKPWRTWLRFWGFALYAWLLTYMMVWTGKSAQALALFAVAMGLHILPIACHLSSEFGPLYDRRGAYLLALSSIAGWACSFTLYIPQQILLNLVALVVGGVIVTAAIHELPREKEGRFGYFVSGAAAYVVLLLILSHFEDGGRVPTSQPSEFAISLAPTTPLTVRIGT